MSKVLVVGSGGREHCLAWKLLQSEEISQVFVSPGNAGTGRLAKCNNAQLPINDHQQLAVWCVENQIELVVVGPEDPLANGIVDSLTAKGIKCFGPSAIAARIEASKKFAKQFMSKYSIPTARYEVFEEPSEACKHIMTAPYHALVVKASGLAAGKGVVVAQSRAEACVAVNMMMKDRKFSSAGDTIVVEEKLEGEEFSVLCFTDGTNIEIMPPAQDHKRLLAGDLGPNTGGMGAYCPCPQISHSTMEFVKQNILQRAVDGLRADSNRYVGVLYAGIMLTKNGPKVLEFNCRFGDPECQVILPLLDCDLYGVMMACVSESLRNFKISWKQNMSVMAVIMASNGYPGSYKKDQKISGIESVNQMAHMQVFEGGTKLHDANQTVTSGGRVLAVTAQNNNLINCLGLALAGVNQIKFAGACFRNDIGYRGINFLTTVPRKPTLTYASSGVDVGKGDAFVSSIKSVVKESARPGATSELGGFGGLFDLKAAGYNDPVLVSGTDGVGTKLLLAQSCDLHTTIGTDLVAMCVNDILTHNAEPLFFLDYYACGKLQPNVAKQVVEGISTACSEAGCALIGGETAEMPGMYISGHYDLAGFAVGAFERGRDSPLPHIESVKPGDCIIGISSTGIHSNGYSLVRKVVDLCDLKLDDPAPFDKSTTLGQSLLTPTAIYCKPLLPILRSNCGVKCAAHITGGGITGNLPRVLPGHVTAEIDANLWNVPEVFKWIAQVGNVTTDEMFSTFNCGIGMCLVVSEDETDKVLSKCKNAFQPMGLQAMRIGKVVPKDSISNVSQAKIENGKKALSSQTKFGNIELIMHKAKPLENGIKESHQKRKVAVLISGTGTNLQALIDNARSSMKCSYEINLVVSNKKGVLGLKRAEKAGITTRTIGHKAFKSREKFDEAMDEVLMQNGIEIICLAGFMRLLSGWFVRKWRGRIINIHPSLLPSFKGMDAHKQVIEAGVKVTGCTVHFVTEEMDGGAILAQEAVPVHPDDTVQILQERVKKTEHKVYPNALEMIASGRALLDATHNKVVWKKTHLSNGW